MLLYSWRTELKRLLLLLAAAGIVGFLLGQVLLAWVLVLGAYSALNVIQLRRLYRWLDENPSRNRSDPPESFGLWGDIFDCIYKLQKQERKASEFLENIVEKAQESSAALELGVIMIDKNQNLDWWNRASEALLGLKYPQDRKEAVTNLIRDPAFAEYFNRANYDHPLKLLAPGSSNRVLEFQIAMFGEQERLMIVRDITQLHRLELMRKDFVGNVSHELGTPITVIKGYLEAIIDNMDSLDRKWRKPMEQMHQQSRRMENIVKDLLLLSSLETKTLPRHQEALPLLPLLEEIINDTQRVYADTGHEFTVTCEPKLRIVGDRGELYSAFSNLLSNAVKYTPAGGAIAIRAQHADTSFDIEFRDNGIGIPSRHIPRLTERFYRVDGSRSTETGGTGLGLAIVKHVLVRHGGELEIQSQSGTGSTFTCKFPLTRVVGEEQQTAGAPQPSQDSPHTRDRVH